jgi:thioredoxin 2
MASLEKAVPEIVQCSSCGAKNRVPAVAAGTPRCGKCSTALPWIAKADDETFADVVEGSATPVLLDLWAPWCGPCRQVSPALEQLAGRFAGRIKLVKVNVDESPRTAMRFDVKGIPTLMVMRGKQILSRQTGAAPEPHLRAWLESALANAKS